MGASLNVLSLNIEGDKHLNRFIPFFINLPFDVVCLQEVMESDFIRIKTELHEVDGHFIPMATRGKERSVFGLGIFVSKRLSFAYDEIQYHHAPKKDGETLPFACPKNIHAAHRFVQYVRVHKEGRTYCVGHTHFTWTPDGYPNEEQHLLMPRVIDIVSGKKLILLGDLNAPRELDGEKGAIWDMLAKKFHDNIPQRIRSTLDPELHRVKGLERVVDCLFTPAGFVAEVSVISGLSDHQLIAAVVTPVS